GDNCRRELTTDYADETDEEKEMSPSFSLPEICVIRWLTFEKMTGQSINRGKEARVAVVAAGVVSPLGCGLETTLAALREARDCVSPITRFPVEQCRCTTAGQV